MTRAEFSHAGIDPFVAGCMSFVRHGVTADQFYQHALKYPMLTLYVGGIAVGGVVFCDGEWHIGIGPAFHGGWLTKTNLRILREVARRHLVVTIHAHNAPAQRLAYALGYMPAQLLGEYVRWHLQFQSSPQ